ncbi:hypothetical protein GXW71_28765 [Roseomonas hellenica]|uniref:Uncharacterized protein n=1 Tax=Plastoroseomonas hellenica TaxID=2687306 RepID=A0ABS5F756_9PROT|nr:hypothetical protein [Plastoroseomonas hellenica]MBR0668379.1 hypothetical protein [Plastoroseomonas hellenica]
MLDMPRAPYGDLHLVCRPDRADRHLVFPYEVTNAGPVPLLVMDAWPRTAEGSRSADPDLAQVLLRDDGIAVVGKFVPAVPPGMRIAAPLLPLCTVLRPTETLMRELRIPLPLAEQSPYLPELRLSSYRPRELRGVLFAIGWWPLAQPELVAGPAAFAPGLQVVAPIGALPPAGTAIQRFPTTKLEILRRSDAFPREVPAHPDLA